MTPVIHLRDVTKGFPRLARRRDIVRGLLSHAGLAHAPDLFYALKGVSLSIPRGQTWGIVGRNGSGKSTLLQVIAGTLQPTSGELSVQGRVAALLELGSGFHPEFTGRENVFFQGQLLGCNHEQIAAKLPEILAFASIGDFIDSPVKTYSSGMMLRLAFAVTITLDPDILIVDEALAVGDEAFQRKCFGRIRALRDQGCTVLFVSHSGQQIIELCDRALLLDGGDQLLVGNPKEVVGWYHKLLFAPPERTEEIRRDILAGLAAAPVGGAAAAESAAPAAQDDFDPGLVPQSTLEYPSRGAHIAGPRLLRLDGSPANVLVRGERYRYTYRVSFTEPHVQVRFGMMLKTTSGLELGGGVTHTAQNPIPSIDAGETVEVTFNFECRLQTGVYFANAGVTAVTGDGEVYIHRLTDALMFRVRPDPDSRMTGMIDFDATPVVERVPSPIPSQEAPLP